MFRIIVFWKIKDAKPNQWSDVMRTDPHVSAPWFSFLNIPCFRIKGLSEGQEKLCSLYTDHMIHVGRGARNGIGECQWQFRNHRWNCTTVEDTTVFGPVLSIRKNTCFRLIWHYSRWEPPCFVWLWCNLILTKITGSAILISRPKASK